MCVRGKQQRRGEGREGDTGTHVVRGDAAFLLLPHSVSQSLTHSLVSFPWLGCLVAFLEGGWRHDR